MFIIIYPSVEIGGKVDKGLEAEFLKQVCLIDGELVGRVDAAPLDCLGLQALYFPFVHCLVTEILEFVRFFFLYYFFSRCIKDHDHQEVNHDSSFFSLLHQVSDFTKQLLYICSSSARLKQF